jgi:hypothetical protein
MLIGIFCHSVELFDLFRDCRFALKMFVPCVLKYRSVYESFLKTNNESIPQQIVGYVVARFIHPSDGLEFFCVRSELLGSRLVTIKKSFLKRSEA